MAQFIAAIHAVPHPRALALVETSISPAGQIYTVRDVRPLGADAHARITSLLASEPHYVGNTTVVTTGGQAAADALHATGPSAIAVTLVDDSTPSAQDTFDVTAQVLVDTFEMLFRAGAVVVPLPSEEASNAVHAMYQGADLENAALDGAHDAEDDGPEAEGGEPSDPGVIMAEGPQRMGRIAARTSGPSPDLGDHESVAFALALAVWYGETRVDDLPMTDQADEVLGKRDRRNAARSS